ncbi:disintegrin and metalloproteinase domain-containing protein 10 [Elysia marginata]|uniref:Disintegrin and metalloproteinase domain-containing protein 10 n=1 Tax=Elysia marginata TaxID=1093978 RepID=A0AAV4ED72_9GAST|nr:disintegrin and metalloproteinase domain-containing protein 10 [Elysia marginata]
MGGQLTFTLLVGSILFDSVQFSLESSDSMCQRPWVERMFWTSQNPTQPSSDAFREDVLLGKPARVVIEQGSYKEAFTLDNVNMNGNLICGEEYSPDNAPVSSRYLDGSSSMQYADNYVAMAMKSEMRGVMKDRGYVFNMDNVHIDQASGHISAQSLNHVSQRYTLGGGISFKPQPYYWLSSWETSGRRDSARWTMGGVKPVGHTNDYVALQWFADACWTIVYKHDGVGKRLAGSLDMLRTSIRMGRRVRVHFNGFTLEASSVIISPGGSVMAQTSTEMARRLGSGSDKTFFNTKTRQIYRLIHTTGEVLSLYFFIEDGLLSERSADRFDVTWSVDTRPWSPVLAVDAQNKVNFGSIKDLVLNMDVASTRIQIALKVGAQTNSNHRIF